MKILLAEDNTFFRSLLEVHLRRWGHEIVACDNGEQALEHLKQPIGPRIAILDWEMPKMHGVEVCRRLRSLKDHHYVYIILLTSKSDNEHMEEGLDSGADEYMVKPFNPVDLRGRLGVASRIVEEKETLRASPRPVVSRAKQDTLTGSRHRSANSKSLEYPLVRLKHRPPHVQD